MIVTLRVFGWAVLSLEIEDGPVDLTLAGIAGGPTRNFERDYADETDDRALGFRA